MTDDHTDTSTLRCAIYTRKSTDEGLEQEFNSLDAQREAGEAFITSQRAEGWVCLPEHYDDGGFTGGNMERPALKRLLADIGEGKIDCIVVYKVDRLSRSLIDFSKIMDVLERHHVSFVSVTQQFNTSTSMGRLMLNVLLSFAQFEREMISERTRDKIAATRRKGKWSGGRPVLGYDVAPEGGRLVVNEEEAVRVRGIFELYLEVQSLGATANELRRRGWTAKRWTNRKGTVSGGRPFNKSSIYTLLRNPIYLGKMRYRDELHEGEHPAIVEKEVFAKAQRILKRNGRHSVRYVPDRFGALLKGLTRCTACQCSMAHTHTQSKTKRYRYYVCTNAQKYGWHNCPSPSVPAPELERFVVEQIKHMGTDAELLEQTLVQCRTQREQAINTLAIEKRTIERELRQLNGEIAQLAQHGPGNALVTKRLADLQQRIGTLETRAVEVRDRILALSRELVEAHEVRRACEAFDPMWETLNSAEQARILHLLVERVDYDGPAGTVAITFRPTGIKSLTEELDRLEVT